jgi:N-acetyl-anhydromuramyl-L-alanine amidase AmpD
MSWRDRRTTDRANMDYPGTRYWIPSPNFRPREGAIQFVVVHCTLGPAVNEGPAVNKFLAGGGDGPSIHYIVNRQGEVTQMVRDHHAAYHTGGSIRYYANQAGVGIENVNRHSDSPTADEYRASAALVRWLCEQYSIPKVQITAPGERGIIAHRDVSPNRKPCPGRRWDWDLFVRLVNGG